MQIISTKTESTKGQKIAVRVSVSLLMLALGFPASASGPSQTTDSSNPAFHPVKAFKHWIEVGQASWYGHSFQGHKTANGESYDMKLLTCAHRTLPLGSWVKVTNLKNRKSVVVRVNDRGPALDNRIVDLSYAAAQAVGLRGIGKVRLDSLHDGDPELVNALVAQIQMPRIPVLPLLAPLGNFR